MIAIPFGTAIALVNESLQYTQRRRYHFKLEELTGETAICQGMFPSDEMWNKDIESGWYHHVSRALEQRSTVLDAGLSLANKSLRYVDADGTTSY